MDRIEVLEMSTVQDLCGADLFDVLRVRIAESNCMDFVSQEELQDMILALQAYQK